MHGPWAELDPDQHPGGPLEPAQLHQDAGGQHPAICGRSVSRSVGRVSQMLVAFGFEYRLWCCLEWVHLHGPVLKSREGQGSEAISISQ